MIMFFKRDHQNIYEKTHSGQLTKIDLKLIVFTVNILQWSCPMTLSSRNICYKGYTLFVNQPQHLWQPTVKAVQKYNWYMSWLLLKFALSNIDVVILSVWSKCFAGDRTKTERCLYSAPGGVCTQHQVVFVLSTRWCGVKAVCISP